MLGSALRTINGCHEFIIKTDAPDYLDVLIGLGYGPLGVDPDEHLRRFPAFRDVDATYERFALHLQPMLDQASRRTAAPWEDALSQVCARAGEAELEWFLVGSAAMAVRGVPVCPRDVDIVVGDHLLALEVFADILIQPPLFHPDGSFVGHWSARAFAGSRVEWVSFIHPGLDSWLWPNEVGSYASERLETVMWQGWSVRVPPLTLQLEVTDTRQMVDRAALIRGHLGV